jgi:protein-tyrosine phosphatase
MPDWFRAGERLFGGRYPVELPPGVDFVVDLTEEGELPPYARDGLDYRRMPIRDFGVPSEDEMRNILDTIDEALAAGRTVFVHCRGGIGRTGTVIGCYFRRHGTAPQDEPPTPETRAQVEMIRDWPEGE